MKPRLQEKFETEIRPAIAESASTPNFHTLTRLEKIVLNMGVGSAVEEKKHMETAVSALATITGQKPVITLSRKSIAAFRHKTSSSEQLELVVEYELFTFVVLELLTLVLLSLFPSLFSLDK